MTDLTGSIIKGYEIREWLGGGGFGEVYRAYQSTIGREVAVKVIHNKYSNQPDFIRRFEAEAQVIARLEHWHIVPLYDFWRDPSGAYIVMRWLRGGSLRDLLQKERFAPQQAAILLDQITSALSLAHRNGIIHRDLKPANILLDEERNAYLADFGIAKDLNASRVQHTEVDTVVGDPYYMSPEQARSEPVTPRTDIYSLGVVLYEVLSGQHPFPNLSRLDEMFRHINDPLPKLTNLQAEVSDAVNDVIQKATAKNPAHRFAEVLSMSNAFYEAIRPSIESSQRGLEEQLTLREHEILFFISQHLSNKEIARELMVEVSTVKWHINELYKKLGVNNRVQAILTARKLHILNLDKYDEGVFEIDGTTFHPQELLPLENPYKGLLSFQVADARDFFGREKLTRKLLKHIAGSLQTPPALSHIAPESQRFLAVVGPSGSGKSSLIRAGLVPALARGEIEGSERWFTINMIPGPRPMDELEVALMKVAANHAGNLGELLQRDEYGLVRAAQLILPNDNSYLVIVIDQFEEVFTLVTDENARLKFLNMLVVAASDLRSRVYIVVTLRADFYDRPLQYPTFGELVRTHMETVLPLSAEELESAIGKPAERLLVRFEPGLVSHIVEEALYQPSVLPLLQYALTELFERRNGFLLTHEAYEQIGGLVGALAKGAEETFTRMDAVQQELTRQIFLRLVTLGEGTEDTRRRTARSELLAIHPDKEQVEGIIDRFAESRLLSLDHDPASRSPMVEVAHEAILREWDRLKLWLNLSRDEIRWQRQLVNLASDWYAASRDMSFLISGARLEQFERFAAETDLLLTEHERKFLESSIAQRQQLQTHEEMRQLRERRLQTRTIRQLQIIVVILLIASMAGISLTLEIFSRSRIAERERDRASAAGQQAQLEASQNRSLALAANAQEALLNNDTDLAIALALESYGLEYPPLQAEQALAAAIYSPGTRRVLEGHTGPVGSVAISPDGTLAASGGSRRLAFEITGANRYISYPAVDFSIRLWDLGTGQERNRLEGHTDSVWDVAFSPDGKTLLSASADHTLILWDVRTGERIATLIGHGDAVRAVAFSSDGMTVLSGSDDNSLYLWNLATATPIRRFTTRDVADVWEVAFSPNGQYAIATYGSTGRFTTEGRIVLWEVATGQEIRRFDTNSPVRSLAFSPDGRHILLGTDKAAPNSFNLINVQSIMVMLDIETGEEIKQYFHGYAPIMSIAYSPDGLTAVAAGGDQLLMLWDLDTGRILHIFNGHTGWISDVAFSDDGQHLISSSDDHTVRYWDVRSGTEVQRLVGHTAPVHAVSFSPDGEIVASASVDRSIILWDSQTGEMIRQLRGHESRIGSIEFSPDGLRLVSGSSDHTVRVWDVATGQELQRLTSDLAVSAAAISPDGRYVLAAETNAVSALTPSAIGLRLWDLMTSTQLWWQQGHDDGIWSDAISPDRRYGISSSFDNTLRLWDLETGDETCRLEGHIGYVAGVAFTPDGRQAISAGEDRSLILWDIETCSLVRRFMGHSLEVYDVAVSPNGRYAASVGADRLVILWDLQTGEKLRSFEAHRQRGIVIAFSPDGSSIVTGEEGGDAILWRIADTPADIIQWGFANRYIRELTCAERVFYDVQSLCGPDNESPTRTPFPTPESSLTTQLTPTSDPLQVAPSLTWTPFPFPTIQPTATLNTSRIEMGTITPDQPITGSVFIVGIPQEHVWRFTGTARQTFTLENNSFGVYFELYGPDGNLEFDQASLDANTPQLGPLTLPTTGDYVFIVGPDSQTRGGRYTVTLRLVQDN